MEDKSTHCIHYVIQILLQINSIIGHFSPEVVTNEDFRLKYLVIDLISGFDAQPIFGFRVM